MFRGRSAASVALLWARSRGRDRNWTNLLLSHKGTKTTKRFLVVFVPLRLFDWRQSECLAEFSG